MTVQSKDPLEQEFTARVSRIPFHGMGLSVDIYSPNLFELGEALDREDLPFGYLEIFKAPHSMVKGVRSRYPSAKLEYHADGLWVTQPDLLWSYSLEREIGGIAGHLSTLQSDWVTQECASKQMAGYSFGTYLPPLFTPASARATANNVRWVQTHLDELSGRTEGGGPLFLLETPPLTYFAFGEVSYPDFFHVISHHAACGLVLDIGHVWTVYRYTGCWRRQSLSQFLDTFLEAFPLERVVQIHMAGLGVHLTLAGGPFEERGTPPLWIDAHEAPVPDALFDMMDQVLRHPRLVNLKGIALEVDTKSPALIVQEYRRFRQRFEWWGVRGETREYSLDRDSATFSGKSRKVFSKADEGEELLILYRQYVRTITGQGSTPLTPIGLKEHEGMESVSYYAQKYLPYEILRWSGELMDLFPETTKQLKERGILVREFLEFWFQEPRTLHQPYDFFLLKIDLFLEFVQKRAPDLGEVSSRESEDLRIAYSMANEHVVG